MPQWLNMNLDRRAVTEDALCLNRLFPIERSYRGSTMGTANLVHYPLDPIIEDNDTQIRVQRIYIE
jgi:hypothetical protein